MSIFGAMDAKKISTNPFWVAAGEYSGVIDEAKFQENKTKETTQLVISYKISNKDSKYFGKKVREYFTVYPEMTQEIYDLMSAEEQADYDRNTSNVKRRLCGYKDNVGLGVAEEELNGDWAPKTLVNTEVEMGVINGGDDDEYTNIKWVRKVE